MFTAAIQILEEAGLLAEKANLFFYDKDMNLIDRLGDVKVPCLTLDIQTFRQTFESGWKRDVYLMFIDGLGFPNWPTRRRQQHTLYLDNCALSCS